MRQALTEERITGTATRIFAGLGYDMASLDLIAEALGAPAEQVKEPSV